MPGTEKTQLIVQVKPNARQNRFIKFEDGVLHLAIAPPPRDGQANRELLNFLSDILKVAKSDLSIARGLAGRRKLVTVNRLSAEQLLKRIDGLPG